MIVYCFSVDLVFGVDWILRGRPIVIMVVASLASVVGGGGRDMKNEDPLELPRGGKRYPADS